MIYQMQTCDKTAISFANSWLNEMREGTDRSRHEEVEDGSSRDECHQSVSDIYEVTH